MTNLPYDTRVEELLERFGRCGVIEEDDEGEPKIKMYAREDGSFSGDALVVFFKEDSVTLAVNLMDEAELRLGDGSTRMKVQKAEFGHKQHHGTGEQGGERKVVNRKKATKRIGKMQRYSPLRSPMNGIHGVFRKLEDWDSEDEFGPALTAIDKLSNQANKNGRVVVLKHMFTLGELEEDPSLLLDLKEDVREECSTLGDVTNVVLYDVRESLCSTQSFRLIAHSPIYLFVLQQEPEGIMTVKFRDPISAKACIIVSYRHRHPVFTPNPNFRSAEDARQVLRRPSGRGLPLHRPTAVQTFERRRRRHTRRRSRFGTTTSRRVC